MYIVSANGIVLATALIASGCSSNNDSGSRGNDRAAGGTVGDVTASSGGASGVLTSGGSPNLVNGGTSSAQGGTGGASTTSAKATTVSGGTSATTTTTIGGDRTGGASNTTYASAGQGGVSSASSSGGSQGGISNIGNGGSQGGLSNTGNSGGTQASVGGTCNGGGAGSVCGGGADAGTRPKSPCVIDPGLYSGTLTAQISAALVDLYAQCPNGGVVDARQLAGPQTLGALSLGQLDGGALSQAKPVTLLLGPGSFTVTGTITVFKGSSIVGTVDSANAPNTILLAGVSQQLQAVVAVGADSSPSLQSSGDSSSLRDLVIDGNRAQSGTTQATSGAALLITGPSSAVSLVNVWVRNSANHGIVVRGLDATHGTANTMFRRVKSTENANAGLYDSFAVDHFIYESEFSQNGQHGVWLADSGGIRLQQSTLANNGAAGVYSSGSSASNAGNNMIFGNVLTNNGSAGVHIDDYWGGDVVAGNSFSGGCTDPAHGSSAIELSNMSRSIVVANTVESPADGNGRYSWKHGFELVGSTASNLVQSAAPERKGTVILDWYSGTSLDKWADNESAVIPLPSIAPFRQTPAQPPVPGGDSNAGADASLEPGNDAGEKIANALRSAYAKGCTSCWVDARNLVGNQSINQPLIVGDDTHAVTLFLGHAIFTIKSTIQLGAGSNIVGLPTGGVVNWDFPNTSLRAGANLSAIITRQGGDGGGIWDVNLNASPIASDASAAAIVVTDATNVVIADTSINGSNANGILEQTAVTCGSAWSGNQVTRTLVLDAQAAGLRAENINGLVVTQSQFERAVSVGIAARSAPNLVVTNSDVSSAGALTGYGDGITTSGTACPPNWDIVALGNLLTNRGSHVRVASNTSERFDNHYIMANDLMGGMLDPTRAALELVGSDGQVVGNLIRDQPNAMTFGWRTEDSVSPYWWITANLVGSQTTSGMAGSLAASDIAAPENLYVP